MLIDTHCHLQLPPFSPQPDSYISAARNSGVSAWIIPGINPADWGRLHELSIQQSAVYPAFGIHPLATPLVTPPDLEYLEQIAPTGVAIGEIGLDRRLPDIPRQEELFRSQLRIARRYQLPILIHCCRMIERTLAILHEEYPSHPGGIMHGFSGSLESAQRCIRHNLAIGIGSRDTRAPSLRYLKMLTGLPLATLVLETDAPSAHDGCRNMPNCLNTIANAVATHRSVPYEQIAAETTATVRRIIPKLRPPTCS